MATIRLPSEFKEFLKLLNARGVEYLLIGGYAVGFHGYPRATIDIDIWVSTAHHNAELVLDVLREFMGIEIEGEDADAFREPDRIARIGVPPLRIEILTSATGVNFDECFRERIDATIDGVEVHLINLQHLKTNKMAAGRLKDLNDLEQLQ